MSYNLKEELQKEMKTKMLVNTQNRKCSYPSAVYDHCRIRDR